MAELTPWLLLAGTGALHGLNPASGWMPAAACGLRAHDGRQALRALLPIALGHAASIAMVAGLIRLGLGFDGLRRLSLLLPSPLPLSLLMAAALLLVTALHGWSRRGTQPRRPARTGGLGLALWSFWVTTAHGSGMMLVPALIPLCLSDSPAREITASGSLLLALAAVAVHGAAMLLVTALAALGACKAVAALRAQAPT